MTNIHPTAVVDPSAAIHETCVIGPYVVIGAGVRLAAGNIVGPHTVLDGDCDIGPGNHFLASCSIGASPQITRASTTRGGVVIGQGNVFREFVTVHAGAVSATAIGSRGLFMATAHVAHDCLVGDEVILANGATLGGHVVVGDKAQISGLCAVHQHVRIGTLAFVAGGSIVTQDVAPFCLVQGDRAKLISLNTVGLRRAGRTSQEISALKRGYRLIFQGSDLLAERLAAAALAEDEDTDVAKMVTFIRNSVRGVITSRRRTQSAAA